MNNISFKLIKHKYILLFIVLPLLHYMENSSKHTTVLPVINKQVVVKKHSYISNLCFNGIKPKKLSKKDKLFILSINENASLEDKYKLYRLVYQSYLYLTKNKVLSEAFATQFVLESAYGVIRTGKFNYGGIKEFNPNKSRKLCRTTEMNCNMNVVRNYKNNNSYYGKSYYNGNTIHYVGDYFKNFKSLEQYLNFKINMIKNDDNYKGCWQSKSIEEYCDCIEKAGYATDVDYGSKLKAVINFWNNYTKENK